jgi:hypothetical protein
MAVVCVAVIGKRENLSGTSLNLENKSKTDKNRLLFKSAEIADCAQEPHWPVRQS